MLNRFPETGHEPEVLYTLYLITRETDTLAAEEYATRLKTKHPTSSFAKILINPDYLQESSQAAEKQKGLYKDAYDAFLQENYIAANFALDEAFALGETSFNPTLELLRVLIVGQTEDITVYQYQLGEYIKANEGNELATYAQKLLDASREFLKNQEKRRGIQYVRSLEEPHYFVLVSKSSDQINELATSTLESFNRSSFKDLNLRTSNLILNDQYHITFVADIPGISTAIDYYITFNEKLPDMTGLRNHKFDNFVITKDNFDIFYRTKGLDEYLLFFQKNYPTENP